MNTIKSLSENVRISKINKTFKTRDYEVELNELGSVKVIDWSNRTDVSVRQFHYDNEEVYSRDFVSINFDDWSDGNHDNVCTFISFEQARELRDQLNALDI